MNRQAAVTVVVDVPSAETPTPQRASRLHVLTVYLALVIGLMSLARLLLAMTALPLGVTLTPQATTLTVDGQAITLRATSAPTNIVFEAPQPNVREYQIDGTDSTNNFTEDPAYLASLARSPYYRFQAWMRDFGSYDAWRDISVSDQTTGKISGATETPGGTVLLPLPSSRNLRVTAKLFRPETPTSLLLLCGGSPCFLATLDRNDRYVAAESLTPSGQVSATRRVFFPLRPGPFAAEVAYFIVEVGLWALLAGGAAGMLAYSVAVGLGRARIRLQSAQMRARVGGMIEQLAASRRRAAAWPLFKRMDPWDALATLVALASLGVTLWIATVQYQSQPHILDASAYLFQAKIFASGRLTAPAPRDPAAFQGPFMIVSQGRWFSQYPPVTPALLALGLLLHVPFAVEPVLGTLALWGIYRIGRTLFSPITGVLAMSLGALSPFYAYLAASYMSHTVALFFGVYFVLLMLRYADGLRIRDIVLAAFCAGGLLLSRELTALLLCVPTLVYVGWVERRRLLGNIAAMVPGLLWGASAAGLCLWIYGLYNLHLTGSPLLLPREVFAPFDRYGFGQGVGFYGQHTLAAGFINLDEQLTILAIDLFGWPFYLTLALLPIALLPCGRRTWDIYCLLIVGVLCAAQLGFYYHGIYLGPRYLFDTLPFLLLLTARGITGLARVLARVGAALTGSWQGASRGARIATGVLVCALLSCGLGYYWPRQVALHDGFTGLSAAQHVRVATIYAERPAGSIVVTSDWYLYNYVLWPLNDPNLTGSTLYAFAPSPDALNRLHTEFPTRALYEIAVAPDGTVSFTRLAVRGQVNSSLGALVRPSSSVVRWGL